MVKRILKANPVFTFLFLLSFTLMFGIAYYGMSLKGRLQQVEQTTWELDYGYRNSFLVLGTANGTDIKLPELNSGILCYMTNVYGEDIVNLKSAYVVMEMNEPMLEQLAEGEGFTAGKEYGMPQCICGMAWQKYIKEEGGKRILSLNEQDYEVAGILEPNGFSDSDQRLFLYEPSLQTESMDELFGMNSGFLVDYRTKEQEGSADIEKFMDWLMESFTQMENIPNMAAVDGGMTSEFQVLMPIYQKFVIFMLVFCFFDCAYLTYVWCTQKLRENMIKRVFGFPLARIWLEGLLETMGYEALSLLISSVFCFLLETVRGNTQAFLLTWKHGAGLMGTVVLLFTVPLSIINILYLRNIKPAGILKAAE